MKTSRALQAVILITMAAALAALPLMSLQPNRILPGDAHYFWQLIPGWASALVVLCWLLAWRWYALATVLCVLAPGLFVWAALAGESANRIGIASGAWLMLVVSFVALKRYRFGDVLLLALWLLAFAMVENLSLRLEWLQQQDAFGYAFLQHLMLVGTSLLITFLVASVIVWRLLRQPRRRRLAFSFLSFLQTIPSIALFGLLMVPLSWLANEWQWLKSLGVSGIGNTPAIIALVAYSLLPMVRNAYVGLTEIDRSVLDVADGMGMQARQIFWQVRVPLALPMMLEGVRVTTVQAIGLVTIAALIGAGGFGRFIFQGLGQAAMEMVLLGALPTILLALTADRCLSFVANWVRYDRV